MTDIPSQTCSPLRVLGNAVRDLLEYAEERPVEEQRLILAALGGMLTLAGSVPPKPHPAVLVTRAVRCMTPPGQ